MSRWHVELSPLEAFYAARLAVVSAAKFAHKRPQWMSFSESIRYTYWAFASEYALHKITGYTWFAGLRRFTTPTDVGPYQVKSTDVAHYHLIVPFNAPDETPFLLANVYGRGVVFRGWIRGSEAKALGKWVPFETERPKRPEGWWIAPAQLKSMDELRLPRTPRRDALSILRPVEGEDVLPGCDVPFHGAPPPPEMAALARRVKPRIVGV